MTRARTDRIVRHLRAVLPGPQAAAGTAGARLGEPLDIRGVAALVGCSTWTVRQTLIPQGLPCFRSGTNGKLIFYTEQVVRWIESHQRVHRGTP